VLAGLINQHKPEIVLVSATPQGRDLGPRVAARLSAGLTADSTGLDIDEAERLLVQTRPAFGGNLMATIVSRHARPQMATVRPGVMKALERDESRTGELVEIAVHLDEQAGAFRAAEGARGGARGRGRRL
jgi:electron transfer flavoprotein alpha subunit